MLTCKPAGSRFVGAAQALIRNAPSPSAPTRLPLGITCFTAPNAGTVNVNDAIDPDHPGPGVYMSPDAG